MRTWIWLRATGTDALRRPETALRVVVAGIALLAVALAIATRASAPSASATRALVGRDAPGFALRPVEASKVGTQAVTLASMRGQPVVLVFTYTLCPRCLSQTQVAATVAADERASGLRVLLVDSPAESPDIVAAYLQRAGDAADLSVLLDTGGAVARSYSVGLYPTTVLIDSRGVVREVWVGETDAATVRRSLSAYPLRASTGRPYTFGGRPTMVVGRDWAATGGEQDG